MTRKRLVDRLGAIATVLATVVASSVIPAAADPIFPLVVPLGDIPSGQLTVLGQGPITTPGLDDVTVTIDAEAGLITPQFVIDEWEAVKDCSPGYSGVIALSATGTSAGGTLRASMLLSGTRTDAEHAGEAFEVGAAGDWTIPPTEVFPSTQLLSLCVELEPYVYSGADPSPTPDPTSSPTPDPTSSPEPEPSPTPTVTPTPTPTATVTPAPTPTPSPTASQKPKSNSKPTAAPEPTPSPRGKKG